MINKLNLKEMLLREFYNITKQYKFYLIVIKTKTHQYLLDLNKKEHHTLFMQNLNKHVQQMMLQVFKMILQEYGISFKHTNTYL